MLGPNPFVMLSEFSGEFKLGFNKKAVEQCPSTQLQTVASLSRDCTCELKALDKTIVFTVDPNAVNNPMYALEILTVAIIDGI